MRCATEARKRTVTMELKAMFDSGKITAVEHQEMWDRLMRAHAGLDEFAYRQIAFGHEQDTEF